jgi:hypothetical protein
MRLCLSTWQIHTGRTNPTREEHFSGWSGILEVWDSPGTWLPHGGRKLAESVSHDPSQHCAVGRLHNNMWQAKIPQTHYTWYNLTFSTSTSIGAARCVVSPWPQFSQGSHCHHVPSFPLKALGNWVALDNILGRAYCPCIMLGSSGRPSTETITTRCISTHKS